MKIISLFLLIFIFGSGKDVENQNKYLPVYISMYDTTFSNQELLLNLKAAFSVRKIKTISRKDAEAYIYNEVYTVMENYVKSGGDLGDINKKRNYQSANLQNVANSLTLNICVNEDGFFSDTVKWANYTLPINMQNFPKRKWHYMILDSTNAKNMLQMSQSIVDSIIASNALVKE